MLETGEGRLRGGLKTALAAMPQRGAAQGATLLIYHRVGGGTTNELDMDVAAFERQLDVLAQHDVVSLDTALDRLEGGDARPSVVLTFDDGFADVHHNAWPLLRERGLPFTVYLATAYLGEEMQWEGATAKGVPGHGLSWDQIRKMQDSGLLTLGNHTHTHVRPERLSEAELDACTEAVFRRCGVRPRHFTYPWGIPVPGVETALRSRFRSASTGEIGRNLPGQDFLQLKRVPVRRTDPEVFFRAKLTGDLRAERAYAAVVGAAKTTLGAVRQPWRRLRSA